MTWLYACLPNLVCILQVEASRLFCKTSNEMLLFVLGMYKVQVLHVLQQNPYNKLLDHSPFLLPFDRVVCPSVCCQVAAVYPTLALSNEGAALNSFCFAPLIHSCALLYSPRPQSSVA